MALEGPDFSGPGNKTLNDGLIQRSSNSSHYPNVWWENIRIEVKPGMGNEARKIIKRLIRVIEISLRSSFLASLY